MEEGAGPTSDRAGDGKLPVVRIFISSPGDVNEERVVALGVLRRIQTWFQGRLVLVPILWEQEPLLATAGFQQEIDRRAPPSSTDIAIFILWSRLGTPLSQDFVLADGRRPTGTEWEFEDAAVASRAHELPHILVYRKSSDAVVSLSHARPEERRERERQFDAVQAFFAQNFQDETDYSFTGSYHHFQDASEFGRRLEEHLLRELADRLTSAASTHATWHGSPFRGLETFEAEHAPIFFGRTRAIQEVRHALARQVEAERAFVLILGRSGNGKSSLARAGVLPLLDGPWLVESGVEGGFCRRAVMHPGSRSSPLEALAVALLEPDALPDLESHGDATELASLLAESPRSGASHVRGALRREAERVREATGLAEPSPARLLLLVDQMEELFTREGVTDEDRRVFAQILDALARSGDAYVLATLRSDFYPAFSQLDVLMALKEGAGHYDLPAVDAVETAQIVRGPAQVAGLNYEIDAQQGRSLDEILIAEATDGPDALPLLEYALTQLEERKQDHLLTLAAYEEMGGLEGAIARRAETEWASLPEDARQALPAVLRTLVEVDEGGTSVTRRRAPFDEVAPTSAARALVDRLVAARLLVAHGDGDGAVVSVAHEALLRTWPRMADRIDAEAELLRIRSRVRTQATRWAEQRREASLLLPAGKPLDEARQLNAAGFTLTPSEADLIEASEARARFGQRVRRAAVTAIGALAVAALLLALFAFGKQREAETGWIAAEDRLATLRTLYVEEGRRELLAGNADRALVHLSQAYAVGADDPKIRFLIARAAAAVERLRNTLVVAEGALGGATLSPDGTRLAAFHGNAVTLWEDPAGEASSRTLSEPAAPVISLNFDATGTRLVATARDGTVTLWNLTDGQATTVPAHEDWVWDAALSPDGRRLATASADGTVRLWDVDASATRLARSATLRGHSDVVTAVEFSPDNLRLVSASDDGTARIWDATTHAAIATLAAIEGEGARIDSAHYGPDGRRIVTTDASGTLGIWDAHDGRSLAHVENRGHGRVGALFAPSGTLLLSAGDGGDAYVHDADGRLLHTLAAHEHRITAAAWSPDEKWLLTGDADGNAWVWSARGATPLLPLEGHSAMITAVEFAPDGATCLTASEDGTIRVWDVRHREIASSIRIFDGEARTVEAAPTGSAVVITGAGDAAVRWDPEQGPDVVRLETLEGEVAADGLGSTSALGPGDVLVLDSDVSPDGRLAVTGDSDGTLGIWDLESGSLLASGTHDDRVQSVAFAPDGTRIASASRDGTAALWDTASGKRLETFTGHEGPVRSVRFLDEGAHLATTGDDRTVRLWDTTTGAALHALSDHRDTVTAVLPSPDGERIVTLCDDGLVRVWDAATGVLFVRLSGHRGAITDGAFLTGGERLVTVGADGTARVWDLGLEPRLPADIAELVRRRIRWRYEDGRLVATGASTPTAHPVSTVSEEPGQPTNRTSALLIGVSEYPNLGSQLRAPGKDVAAMAATLRDAFGVREEDLTILSGWPADEAARPTRANILRQLDRLASRSHAAGDRVLVHFSGHGSRLADEATGGYDDVLLPADVDVAPGTGWQAAIRDDEMRAHLDMIQRRGADVWLLLDCGFGGTGLRGLGGDRPQIRSLDPATFGVELTLPAPRGDGGAAQPVTWLTALDDALVLQAAAAHQEVPETRDEEATLESPDLGLLTRAFTGALRVLPTDATVGDLAQKIVSGYADAGWSYLQPQVDGDPLRPCFPRSASLDGTGLELQNLPDGSLVLDTGRYRGIRPGTELDVWPRSIRSRHPKPLATVTVDRVDLTGTWCRADEEGALRLAGPPQSWPVSIARVPLDNVLSVCVLTEDDESLSLTSCPPVVRNAFADNHAVLQHVGEASDAAWAIVLDETSQPTQVRPVRAGTGTPAFQTSESELGDHLLQIFRVENILRLARGDVLAAWPDELRLEAWQVDAAGNRKPLALARVQPGNRVEFQVRYDAAAAEPGATSTFDLCLMWMDPHLGLWEVWPREEISPRKDFESGEVMRIPPEVVGDETQGLERIVAFALPRTAGEPVLDLSFLAQERLGIRGRGARGTQIEDLISRLFFGGEEREQVVIDRRESPLAIQVLTFVSGWGDVHLPPPAEDDLVIQVPESGEANQPLPDARALAGDVWLGRAGTTDARCLLLARTPHTEQVLLDLDGNSGQGVDGSEALRRLVDDRSFDAEIAIRRDAKAFTAWYDSDNDGIFDLALVDRNKDLRAEEVWTREGDRWERETGRDEVWLSTAWLYYLDHDPEGGDQRIEALHRIARIAGR